MSSLSIHLFGILNARLNGVPLPGLRHREGERLLAFRTLQQGAGVSYRALAETFWPAEARQQVGEHGDFPNTRQAVHNLRRALYEMTTRGLDITDLEAQADRDEGPFGDHLRRLLVSFTRNVELTDVVRGVLRGDGCPTPESFYHLRSAGIIAGDSARSARPRCQLYASYLTRHLL